MRPIWSGPCSAPEEGSKSQPRPDCSLEPQGGRSSYGTESAPTPTATYRPTTAMSTTSSPSPRTGLPPRKTAGSSADSIIACGTSGHRHPHRPSPRPGDRISVAAGQLCEVGQQTLPQNAPVDRCVDRDPRHGHRFVAPSRSEWGNRHHRPLLAGNDVELPSPESWSMPNNRPPGASLLRVLEPLS